MADTRRLEEDYWPGRRETWGDEKPGRIVTRRFLVPDVEFEALAPPLGSMFTEDHDQTVIRVDKGQRPAGATTVEMLVTYLWEKSRE